MKAIQILSTTSGYPGDEFLRRYASLFCRDHDRRAVCIVCAHKKYFVALHALETYPYVSLDIFHDMADVKWAVGIGQGGGNEQFAGRVAHNVMRCFKVKQ